MWLYIGPEVIAPALSALAAIGGVLMMFWQRVVAGVKALARWPKVGREATAEDEVSRPG